MSKEKIKIVARDAIAFNRIESLISNLSARDVETNGLTITATVDSSLLNHLRSMPEVQSVSYVIEEERANLVSILSQNKSQTDSPPSE